MVFVAVSVEYSLMGLCLGRERANPVYDPSRRCLGARLLRHLSCIEAESRGPSVRVFEYE